MTEIPKSIITALTKYQDRPFILYLEKDLIQFIKNSILGNIKQPEYVIQAQYLKNSYYRLLSHQLCQYYQLQHWNNQQNEIVVTPSENFDYKSFVLVIEDNESEFKRISDVAHEYQAEHSPNVSHSHSHSHNHDHNHNNNHHVNETTNGGIIENSKIDNNPQNNSEELNNLNNGVNPNETTKPKLIVKKIINKPSSQSGKDNQDTSKIENKLSDLKIDENANNEATATISEDSDVSSTTDSTTKSTIESQRASKEALYKKLREEIFLKEDEDQEGEDGEDEQVEQEEQEDQNEEEIEQDNSHQIEYKQSVPNFTKQNNFKNKYNNVNNQRYKNGNYNQYYNSNHQNSYNNRHTNNHHQQHQHQYQMPIQFSYPQMYSPQGLSPTIPQGPILYNPYFPNQPQAMIPQTYAAYTTFPTMPHHQPPPPYDKETERRILNNPYIILPGDDGSNDKYKTNGSNNYKNQQKSKKIYNSNLDSNGNRNGFNKGSTKQ
ncbi:uncharacterized protein KGF55_004253 [Candida pseudojiufengensis]|uniref:uncharacterized protein n=1 Tax=Candida pseudojiufengensis TaxID=497109 RepID=UPI0022247DF0|nr:uncharacterized protein KGF55_004253 [Candida pseudojiufengensis]KAI5960986.1 hypothetical protein KGF55_004253 [Candida pseudojiufengensis]